MAKYSNIKAKINEKITTNGRQAVNGSILNDVLQTMVDSLGADYQFGGLVQPGSSFTAGEQPVVFLATTPGTYHNFGGLVLADGEVALLVWSGSAWSKQNPDIATKTEVSQLGQNNAKYFYTTIKDGFVHQARLGSQNQEVTDKNYYITPYIEVSTGKVYQWYVSEVSNDAYLICYDENLIPFVALSAGTAGLYDIVYLDTTGSTFANIRYVRLSFRTNNIGSFYFVQDNVNKYLWENTINFNDVPAQQKDIEESVSYIKNVNGFEPETKLTSGTTKAKDVNYYVTPYIKVNKNRYTWIPADVDNTYLLEYDSSFNVINTARASSATIQRDYRNNDVAYVRITFKTNNLGGFYENYPSTFAFVKNTLWHNDHNYNVDAVGYQLIKDVITPIQALLDSIATAGYQVIGSISVNSEPIETSVKVAYFASQPGTYINFGGIVVNTDEIALVKQDGTSFVKESIFTASISPEVIAAAVDDWLEEHPEATTTVQDGSITPIKLSSDYFTIAETYEGSTIIGRFSSGANTGVCNMAIGYNNLQNNQGSKNTAIGVQNLCNNTGDHNVAVGYHSGFRITSGSNNVGVGDETNDDLQTGTDNVAIGGWALKRNNIGSKNIAIGTNALHGNYLDDTYADEHDFTDNIAVGYNAARQALSGAQKNILLGNNTQILNDGQNQIVIGHGAYANTNNCCVIGNSDTYLFILGRGNSAVQLRIGNKMLIFNQDGTVSWETV